MRKTVQRNSIFNYLKDSTSHPTVRDIYQGVCEDISTISLSTVYNTLSLMKEKGLVSELTTSYGCCKRYDANVFPHAHLICQECGKIDDTDLPLESAITGKRKQDFDFQVGNVYIYGLCSSCQNKRNYSQPFLTIIQKATYVHFIMTGENTKEIILKCLENIHGECIANNYCNILVECRLIGKPLKMVDIHEIVSKYIHRGVGFYRAIAYVSKYAHKQLAKYAEDISVNGSLPLSVFSKVEDAEKWLMNK